MQALVHVGKREDVSVNINMILLVNIGDVIGGIVLILLAVLLIGGFIIGEISDNKHQKKRFNGGKCPNCGIELKFYKQDTYTWYHCPKCQYTARVSTNGNVDRRYCDIFDCWPHLHECQKDCGADPKMCKHYHDKQKENKTKKIPPKKISEDSWPGMV